MRYPLLSNTSTSRCARWAACVLFATALAASASFAAEQTFQQLEQERQALEARLRDMPADAGLDVRFRLSVVYHDLAQHFSSRNQPVEAEAALTNALVHEEALFGADSPMLDTTLELRAERAWEIGSLERARADYKRLAAIAAAPKASFEKEGYAMASLTALELIEGNLADAAAAWKRVVDLRAARFGETEPAVTTGARELAALQSMARQADAARQSQARAQALSRSAKGPGAVAAGHYERALMNPLADAVESRLPDALASEHRLPDCARARMWLRIARLRAAGPEPDKAMFDYEEVIESVPGGASAPAAFAVVEEQAALFERIGKRKMAQMTRENASNLRLNPPQPGVPSCKLE